MPEGCDPVRDGWHLIWDTTKEEKKCFIDWYFFLPIGHDMFNHELINGEYKLCGFTYYEFHVWCCHIAVQRDIPFSFRGDITQFREFK